MCPTLCNPMDCSPPGSSVHEIFQARILEWVAICFSRESSNPGIEPGSPSLQADSLPTELQGKPMVVKRLPAIRRPGFDLWVEKIPWRSKWQPTPVSLPGKSHGQRRLVSCSPWGRKELGTSERLTLTYTYLHICIEREGERERVNDKVNVASVNW